VEIKIAFDLLIGYFPDKEIFAPEGAVFLG